MGWYGDRILPRLIDVVCANRRMERIRRPSLEGLSGRVLELGFGSGPNLPLYPREVTEVLAVEPSDLGWERSARRRAEGGPPVRRVGLDAQRIELDDAAVDHAVSTWTMCTIPDIDTALAEVRRVLRPGGTLRFVEHGLAEQPSVQRWQHRLTPLQRRVAGGCHLDRDIDGIVEASGLQLEALERFTVPGPKSFGSMYRGVARKVA